MPDTNNLVEIKNLRTNFYLAEGVVRAVDGVNLTIKRGQTIGIVGESGCGKSITAFSMLRLLPPAAKIEEGEILYYRPVQDGGTSEMVEVVNITKLDPGGPEIRTIRGSEISMIFQEPMTSLTPVHTIGNQISEVITLHHKVDKLKPGAPPSHRHAGPGGHAQAGSTVDHYPFQSSRAACASAP